MMTRSLRADMGVMITASHNAYQDNGIKLFGPDGRKLSDDVELEIEALMGRGLEEDLAAPDMLGRVQRIDDAQARYVEIVKATFPRRMTLAGLRIVVDCANGAAHKVAPAALYELGAEVIAIGVAPDGFNINEKCGSTYPEVMAAEVVKHQAHLGIALDGDADRLILADEKGAIIDGDQILALIAKTWSASGRLSKPGIVATVMSNLGLERFLKTQNLTLERTQVGDRYVSNFMRAQGYNVGGEASGHVVLTDFAPTGDGLIAALQVLAALIESGKPASELLNLFTPAPQLLKNIRFNGGAPLEQASVQAAIKAAEEQLGSEGRILVRKSGTEPLIRVMAEGDDAAAVEEVVDLIAAAIADA